MARIGCKTLQIVPRAWPSSPLRRSAVLGRRAYRFAADRQNFRHGSGQNLRDPHRRGPCRFGRLSTLCAPWPEFAGSVPSTRAQGGIRRNRDSRRASTTEARMRGSRTNPNTIAEPSANPALSGTCTQWRYCRTSNPITPAATTGRQKRGDRPTSVLPAGVRAENTRAAARQSRSRALPRLLHWPRE